MELYLKAVMTMPRVEGHELKPLLEILRTNLRREHASEIPAWLENLVLALDDFDHTAFRYDDAGVVSRSTGDAGEFWVDLHNVQAKMEWVANSFQRVRRAQR